MTAKVIPLDQTLHGVVTDLNGDQLKIKRRGENVLLLADLATLDGDTITVCFRFNPDTAVKLQTAIGMAALDAKGREIVTQLDGA